MLASGSGHSGGPWQDSVHIRGRTRKPDSAPEKFGSVVSRFHKKKAKTVFQNDGFWVESTLNNIQR